MAAPSDDAEYGIVSDEDIDIVSAEYPIVSEEDSIVSEEYDSVVSEEYDSIVSEEYESIVSEEDAVVDEGDYDDDDEVKPKGRSLLGGLVKGVRAIVQGMVGDEDDYDY